MTAAVYPCACYPYIIITTDDFAEIY